MLETRGIEISALTLFLESQKRPVSDFESRVLADALNAFEERLMGREP